MSPKSLLLSNGIKMPVIGLGTSDATSDSLIAAVKTSIKNGYRLIDTAAAYNNEEEIGKAISQCISEGLVKREEIFIVTKCPCPFLHPEKQESALKESLQKFQLNYVDLYLAHNPCASDPDVKVEDIWKGLEALYEKKLVRSIGLSNFNIEQIKQILKVSKVPIHCNQIELHLYFQQKEMVKFCKENGIAVMAYAPIGSPKVDKVRDKRPLEDSLVNELSQKYAKTPAQILLRHLVQNDFCVIPKSINDNRIAENFDIFDFELSPEEMEKLNNVPQKERIFWLNFLIGHSEDPFESERKEI